MTYVATEGLEFETAEFYAPENRRPGWAGGLGAAHYERPEVWRARLGLAGDSAAGPLRPGS